jgi:putative inorganic carbon (HCO3(-)) transporter
MSRTHVAAEPLQIPRADPVDRVAGASFVLLCAVLPWAIAPISIAVALCTTATLAAWIRLRPHAVLSSPVFYPGLGWLVALMVSAAFALDPSASWPRVDKGLLPLLAPLAAWHARSPAVARRGLAALLLASIVCSLAGVAEYALGPGGLTGRARGPVGHYMTYGGQLLLLVTLAVGVALAARERRWRVLAAAAAGCGMAALAATYTRSAWLGLCVALVALLGGMRPRLLPWLALAVAAAVALSPPALRERLTSAFDPSHPHNRERTYMWQAGAAMFREDPLTGVGLQDLQPLFERYWPPQARERVGHLHSVPIHVAATMGVVGLAAFAWLMAGLFRAALLGLRRPVAAGGLPSGVRLAVACGLAGLLVSGLFEWTFGDEELLEMVYVLAGIAWGLGTAPRGGPSA